MRKVATVIGVDRVNAQNQYNDTSAFFIKRTQKIKNSKQ